MDCLYQWGKMNNDNFKISFMEMSSYMTSDGPDQVQLLEAALSHASSLNGLELTPLSPFVILCPKCGGTTCGDLPGSSYHEESWSGGASNIQGRAGVKYVFVFVYINICICIGKPTTSRCCRPEVMTPPTRQSKGVATGGPHRLLDKG